MRIIFSIDVMREDGIPSAYKSEDDFNFHGKLSSIIAMLISKNLSKDREWELWLSENAEWQSILGLSGNRRQQICQFLELIQARDFGKIHLIPDVPKSHPNVSWFPNGYLSIDDSIIDNISDLEEIPGIQFFASNNKMQILS